MPGLADWGDNGDVAQLEEHLLCKQRVVGSSPIVSTVVTWADSLRGASTTVHVSAMYQRCIKPDSRSFAASEGAGPCGWTASTPRRASRDPHSSPPTQPLGGRSRRPCRDVERRTPAERGTVGWLVKRWVASRTDVSLKAREQYTWACRHVEAGLGAVRLDRLDREDVAQWLNGLAAGGELSRRSIEICRTILRAALADAVDEGLIVRSPAARVGMPKQVARSSRKREVDAWDHEQVGRFLRVIADHRWGAPMRLAVLYGLRRSELLALKWDDLDAKGSFIRIDEGLIPLANGIVWTGGKSERSRRVIALDPGTLADLNWHRACQLHERLLAGAYWQDHELCVSTLT